MALSVLQTVGAAGAGAGTTVVITVSATAIGSCLVVGITNGQSATVSTITDNASGGSNTYVQATNALGTNAGKRADTWYCLSATNGGATTITITVSASGSERQATFWEVSGFTTAAFDIANNAGGTGSGTTDNGASVTTTGTTGFVVGSLITSGFISANPKAGNEFTSGGATAGTGGGISLISSTAAAHQPVWLDGASGANICTSTAAIKEAASAATNFLLLFGVGG